jgi:hypothetical protein
MELPNDFADNLHRYPLAFLREKYNEMKAEIAADNSRVDLNVYRVLEGGLETNRWCVTCWNYSTLLATLQTDNDKKRGD